MRPARGAARPALRRPVGGERSGQLLRQSLHRLDEAAHLLAGPASRADVSAALAAVLEVRRALAHLVRPDDTQPSVERPSVLRRTELAARPESAREARAFCRDTAERWQLAAAVGSVVTDLAGELVANAVRHGRGPVVLALELGTGQVSVSVFDGGPGRPELLPYRPGVSERGLGLQLVQRLSDRWGWTADGDGKWVWARVSLPAVTSPEEVLPG